MQCSQLVRLFKNELKDIFWAEKVLVIAIAKMIKNASSFKLIVALTNHLEETNNHLVRLLDIFEIIDEQHLQKNAM